MPRVVLVVSDTHIGTEESNEDQFLSFLRETVRSENPDLLILNGDIVDFWRNGIEPAMAETADIFEAIGDIEQRVQIAGNHDWRFREADIQPWDVVERFKFSSGDKEFLAIHGHQYDPANANWLTNNRLCLTSDRQARAIDNLYDTLVGQTGLVATRAARGPLIFHPGVTTLAHLNNPNILSTPEGASRAERIQRRAEGINDEYVIMGHTHIPRVDEDSANAGSWTRDENHYLKIVEGEVELVRHS